MQKEKPSCVTPPTRASTTMADIGDRFKTGTTNPTSGIFVFDGYTDGTSSPAPTQAERTIPLAKDETFPPIRSCNKGCWWKLQRKT